jgi:hypothetical protein
MQYVDPMKETPEGRLLTVIKQIEKSLGIEKNMGCDDPETKPDYIDADKDGDKKESMKQAVKDSKKKSLKKAEMGEKDRYCLKNFGCKYSECSPKQKAQCDKVHGKVEKYVQERSGDNIKPMFMEISGKVDVPASGYQANQVLPFTEEGPKKSMISETYNMPSVAQTGYDTNASSLHMHLTEGGGHFSNVSPIEDSLAEIKKGASAGQIGRIDEIAGLIEQIYARL